MKGWLSNLSENLKFDTTKKEYGQVVQYLREDQEEDEARIKMSLSFTKSEVHSGSRKIVIKDVELAEFPPNLLLDQDGEFLSLQCPITNVLSSEFYWALADRRQPLPFEFKISYWNPIEDEDVPLNIIHSKLEKFLVANAVQMQLNQLPETPLSADLNIFCSHGRRGAGQLPTFFTGEITIIDVNEVVGAGRIAVLFVCHAGASYQAILQLRIMSFVRRLLEKGYSAVVAPFWTLHLSIPPVWLPVFIQKMKEGQFVADAVFEANRSVYEMNRNPAAWACLHLYGDPYVKIAHNHDT